MSTIVSGVSKIHEITVVVDSISGSGVPLAMFYHVQAIEKGTLAEFLDKCNKQLKVCDHSPMIDHVGQ